MAKTIFDQVGEMFGSAIAKEQDAEIEHRHHTFMGNKLDGCERCEYPDRFKIPAGYRYEDLLELW